MGHENARQKLLLVDDEAIIALEQTHRLIRAGFAVTSVLSGESAIDHIARYEPPDLVLMDINLGAGMDGVDAARRIRARWDVPVVFFSNSSDPETVERARSASPYGYIRKLADDFTVAQSIRTAIDLHARTGSSEPRRISPPYDHYLAQELHGTYLSTPEVFALLEAESLDGIWVQDLVEPEHAWLSPQFWRTLGYDPNERSHLTSEWQSVVFPEDRERIIAGGNAHFSDPEVPFDEIVRYRHADGSTVWIRCRGVALRDESGRPLRMLGAHSDITEQIRTQRELEFLMREMNHRIKNNLALLQAMVTVEWSHPGKTAGEVLQDMESRLHAIGLIHDQLAGTAGHDTVSMELYLHELVDRYLRSALPDAAATERTVRVDDLSVCTRVASRIGIVVGELLSNTVKHARPADSCPIRITTTLERREGLAVLRYSDNGRLPDSVHDFVDLPRGTGLELIEMLLGEMRGSVRLERSPETTFVFELPLQETTGRIGGCSCPATAADVQSA